MSRTERRVWIPFRGIRTANDDGIAMMLVLMVMMIASSLSILMLGVVVAQVRPTLFTKKETGTITAAEAGVDATLAQLRNALTLDTSQSPAVVIGDQSQLPCSNAGNSTTESGTLSYTVTVQYFQADPTGHDDAWRNANDLNCTPGSGTTNVAGVSTVPLFAYVRSAGAGAALPGRPVAVGNRTVESVYDFSVTDANIKGGLVRLGLSSPELCMKASTRAATAYVVAASCDDSDPLQKWAYQTDLTIRLAVNIGSGAELCIDSANATGASVNLRACDTSVLGQARQRWSFNDNGHLEGPNMSTQNGNGWCIVTNASATATAVANTALFQATSCGPISSTNGTWNLDATVGAGAAGSQDGQVSSNGQLVNYAKFGRCFDITGQSMDATFLIGYPCKQAINPANVAWNQRLNYDTATGHLSTTKGTDTRCVTAPASPGPTAYVLMVACNPSNIASQRWTFMGNSTGDRNQDYTIRSALGTTTAPLCMTLEDTNPITDLTDNLRLWGSITSESCNGSLRQKWNAPPFPKDSKQHDTAERAH